VNEFLKWFSPALSVIVLLISLVRWESQRDTELDFFKASFLEMKADFKGFKEEIKSDFRDMEKRVISLEYEIKGNPK
jgi:hypothetical protein